MLVIGLDNDKAVKAVVYIAIKAPKLHAVSPLLSRVSVSCRRPRFINYLFLASRRPYKSRPAVPAAAEKQRSGSEHCRSVLSVSVSTSRAAVSAFRPTTFACPVPSLFKARLLSPFAFHGRLIRNTSATLEETLAAAFVVLACPPIIPRPAQAAQKRLGCRPLPVQHVVAHDQSISPTDLSHSHARPVRARVALPQRPLLQPPGQPRRARNRRKPAAACRTAGRCCSSGLHLALQRRFPFDLSLSRVLLCRLICTPLCKRPIPLCPAQTPVHFAQVADGRLALQLTASLDQLPTQSQQFIRRSYGHSVSPPGEFETSE